MPIKQTDESIGARSQMAIEMFDLKRSYKKAGENATVLAEIGADGKPERFFAHLKGSEYVYVLPPKAMILAIK